MLVVIGCGHAPTAPAAPSYAGTWTGTTSQGTAVRFTVSADQKLTDLTVGYDFNGCAGTLTFTPGVAITNVPTAPIPVGSASYESGAVGTANRLLINFLFTSTTDSHGLAIFVDYAACGGGALTTAWTATRR